jgi:hypothetical protein
MEVSEVVAGGKNYHLPRVPLTHDVDDKFLWSPCCYVIILLAKAYDASLDSDDDSSFFLAVINIVMEEECDFEIRLMYAALMRELTGRINISLIIQHRQWFSSQIVETFIISDICGGRYNQRVMSLTNRLLQLTIT